MPSVVKLPPGRAKGCDDLGKWSSRRLAGRSGLGNQKRRRKSPEEKAALREARQKKIQVDFEREKSLTRRQIETKINAARRRSDEIRKQRPCGK
jgi:hypothetical protein